MYVSTCIGEERGNMGTGGKCALRLELPDDGEMGRKGIVAMNCDVASVKPGDRTLQGRASALPTFVGSRRASTKTKPNVPGPKFKPALYSIAQKRQLENQLATKRQRYMTLKKELAEKEKHACKLYDELAELQDKAMAAGLKGPGKVESMAIDRGRIERTARPALVEGRAATGDQSFRDTASAVATSEFIGTLESRLSEIPHFYQEVCHEALRERTEIMGWLADLSRDTESDFGAEITVRLESLKIEEAGLRSRLDEAAGEYRAIITELIQKASAFRSEHENYRIRMRELETSGAVLVEDLKSELRTAVEELAEEREQAVQLRERKSAAEAQLQKTRTRIHELEGQSNGAETRFQQLQGTVKSLEIQLRQRETALEARIKEMHRTAKSTEDLVARTEKQRDTLESRVTELKRKIDFKEDELNKAIENFTKRLGDAENQLAIEKELKCQAEEKSKKLGERCAKLEEKSKQLCDLTEVATGFAVKSEGNKYTDSELGLRNELQSTRSTLAAQNEKLLQVQREKEQMRLVLQQAADQNDPAHVKDKLAAELVAKTEELQKATAESAQLQQNLNMALDKSDGFERHLSELQSKLRAQSKEDLTGYNQKLEMALTQKQLELEQRDRVMQEQSKVLKVRDELIELLKERNPNANGERNGPEIVPMEKQLQPNPEAINRLIVAKSENLEALYRALEGKQMQLTQLEKVVRQMEDESERSQVTRTKLERELARLRLQLNEKSRDQRASGKIGAQPNDVSVKNCSDVGDFLGAKFKGHDPYG